MHWFMSRVIMNLFFVFWEKNMSSTGFLRAFFSVVYTQMIHFYQQHSLCMCAILLYTAEQNLEPQLFSLYVARKMGP